MGRVDRREKLALDEAYRYCRALDKNEVPPHLFKLAHCLKTLRHALGSADGDQFKLTKRLWQRIQMSLFDRLITTFPGYLLVVNDNGEQVAARSNFPDQGMIELHPEGCRRADDVFRMEIKDLYPGTEMALRKTWKGKGAKIQPTE